MDMINYSSSSSAHTRPMAAVLSKYLVPDWSAVGADVPNKLVSRVSFKETR